MPTSTRRRPGLQYVTDDKWIPELGIRYKLGIDGLNLWLVALTTRACFAVARCGCGAPGRSGPRLFAFHFGLGETAVLGAFVAQDLALFVLFFDLMLVPFYFLVGQWGGPDRVAGGAEDGHLHARRLAADAGRRRWRRRCSRAPSTGGHITFVLSDLQRHPLPESTQKWIFVDVRARVPDQDAGVPVPRLDARRLPARCRCRRWRSSPACVSKVAAYGFLRLVLPLFPAAAHDFQMVLLILALVVDPLRLGAWRSRRRTRG